MSFIYDLDELSRSGLGALHATQRDWSPYLVHFTSRRAMKPLFHLLGKGYSINAHSIKCRLMKADSLSFQVFTQIVEAKSIQRGRKIPRCVCLSECSLPGVVNHSERYGRFGFMFEKGDIYDLGGRPCVYVEGEVCQEIKKMRETGSHSAILKLDGYANTFRPASPSRPAGSKVQDYTVEREWRIMSDIPLDKTCGLLCPLNYYSQISSALALAGLNLPVFPLDMLYKWGV